MVTTGSFEWGKPFIYLITVVSMHMLSKGLHAANTNAFLRNAYGGILFKLFGCAAAAFIYILASGNNLSKRSLITCMFSVPRLYFYRTVYNNETK
jgi:mannose/fructose/N-acetylgalactosamine-specific phosphotransferase system component IIC